VDPTAIAISGPFLLAAGVALLAGLVSFASPCVVPLVPGYLAYLAALVGADAPDEKSKKIKVLGAVGLFVLGFTVVFAAGVGGMVWLSDTLFANQAVLGRVGGGLLFVVGVLLVTGLWAELTNWLKYTVVTTTELPL
jgi:cytochrome c-type biogenesis protein